MRVCEATVCPPDVARGRVMCCTPSGIFVFFSIAMRQTSKCQHHLCIYCACARRSHSCPAGSIPGGVSERKRGGHRRDLRPK